MKNFKAYRWALFGIIGVLYFMVCLQRVSPTVIARDLILSLNADAMILGIISSSYFYLYSAVQPVVGYLSDTVGPRKIMAFFFALSAAGCIIFGMAPNATTAIVGRALIGAGLGGVFIPSLKIFSRWYRANQFAGLTGIMLTIGGLGGLAAALPLTYLVVLLGWRGSFVSIGLFSFVLALACWIIIRDMPEAKGWISLTPAAPAPVDTSGESSLKKRLVMIFGSLDFLMVSLSTFFTGGVFLTFQGLWSMPYLMDVFGLDRLRAGWMLMAMPLGFALGGPSVGFLADRFNLNRKKFLLWALGLSILGWAALIFIREREYLIILAPLFFLFGLVAGGTLPLCFTITRDLFPPWLMGTATGLMNTAAFFGTAVYQPFTGYLLKHATMSPTGTYAFEAYRTLLIVFLISYAAAFLATTLLSGKKSP